MAVARSPYRAVAGGVVLLETRACPVPRSRSMVVIRAAPAASRVQQVLHEIGGGGLALGAGDADELEPAATAGLGDTVEAGQQQAQGLAGVPNDQVRNAGRAVLDPLADHRGCARFDCLVNIGVPVAGHTLAGDKEPARLDLPAVIGDAGEGRIGGQRPRRGDAFRPEHSQVAQTNGTRTCGRGISRRPACNRSHGSILLSQSCPPLAASSFASNGGGVASSGTFR